MPYYNVDETDLNGVIGTAIWFYETEMISDTDYAGPAVSALHLAAYQVGGLTVQGSQMRDMLTYAEVAAATEQMSDQMSDMLQRDGIPQESGPRTESVVGYETPNQVMAALRTTAEDAASICVRTMAGGALADLLRDINRLIDEGAHAQSITLEAAE